MTKKVLVLRGDSYKAVGSIFAALGFDVTFDDKNLGVADIVVFTGGSDVSPYIYGEEPDGARGCDPKRDEYEKEIFDYCISSESKNPAMIGICRGGQLLNVLNGGKMIQHLGRTITGDALDDEGRVMRVDHHQGMLAGEGELLSFYDPITNSKSPEEVPDYAIWYPDTKCLCFQPHPEWGHKGTEDYFFELVEEYIVVG